MAYASGSVSPPEDANADATLTVAPNGTYDFTLSGASSALFWENIVPDNSPILDAYFHKSVTSPDPSRLNVSVDGYLVFSPGAVEWMKDENVTIGGISKSVYDWLRYATDDSVEDFLKDKFEGKDLSEINMEDWVEDLLGKLPPKWEETIKGWDVTGMIEDYKSNLSGITVDQRVLFGKYFR